VHLLVLYCRRVRGGEGSKLYDKIKLEKEKENSKLNRQQRKQDKMLFVAFYILLNLVRQSARNPLWKFVIFSICLLSFSFSSLLFFASFCYVVDNLSISPPTCSGIVCCIFDFTFLCRSMRLVELILSFLILCSLFYSPLIFLFPFFPLPPLVL
jgi:hypothetical protein